MKKYISILLAAMLALSVCAFSACNKSNDGATATDGGTTAEETTVAEETEILTDENGETVTDENGEAVTVAKTDDAAVSEENGTSSTASASVTTENTTAATKSGTSDTAETDDSYLKLTADSTTVKAGSTVKIYLSAPSCKLFADADITFTVDGNASIKKALATSDTDDIDYFQFIQNITSDTEADVAFYTATTADISGIKVCYIEIKVDSGAASGSKIKITSKVNTFETGTDASGSSKQKLSVNNPAITLTVA